MYGIWRCVNTDHMNRGMNIHKHQLDCSWVLTIPNWKLSTQCPWQPCFSEATKLRSDWPFAKPDGLRRRFLVEWACRGNTGRIMVGRGILANQMGIAPTKFSFVFFLGFAQTHDSTYHCSPIFRRCSFICLDPSQLVNHHFFCKKISPSFFFTFPNS